MTTEESLDYEFLKYIGVVPETQKRIKEYYVPFFEGCETVIDLGCGQGDFLELLKETNIEGLGVDYDPKCCEIARERGLDVACQDVFVYLREANEESVDGVFSAHLVEHLPYEKVIELFRLSYRVLRKGGKIVITTPNVRGLFAHLEMFYMHFGHVSFYHPNLLRFFLEHVGFSDVQMGENPRTASPLLSGIPRTLNDGGGEETRGDPVPLVSYDLQLPLARDTIFHRLFRVVKMFAVRLFVQPYLDRITVAINTSLAQVDSRFAQVQSSLAEVDSRSAQVGDSLAQVDSKFAHVENRLTEVDGRLAQVSDSLAQIDDRLAQVQSSLAEVDGRLAQVSDSLAQVDSKFAHVENRLIEVDGRLAQADDSLAQIDDRLAQVQNSLAEVDSRLAQADDSLAQVDGKFGDVYDMLRQIKELDRPFECYVAAVKR